MNRRKALLAITATPLAGCAALTAVGEATGVLDKKGAVSLYGIAKGLAEVALVADPALGSVLTAAIAVGDALLQDAAAGAAQIVAQANTLILAAAPVIKAVPSGAA